MGLGTLGQVPPALPALGGTGMGNVQAVSWTLGPRRFLCLDFPHRVDVLGVLRARPGCLRGLLSLGSSVLLSLSLP